MNKIGEVVFYDGHSEDILCIVHLSERYAKVVTKSGTYVYSTYVVPGPDGMQIQKHEFYTSAGLFDDDRKPMTDQIAMFRLYDRELTT